MQSDYCRAVVEIAHETIVLGQTTGQRLAWHQVVSLILGDIPLHWLEAMGGVQGYQPVFSFPGQELHRKVPAHRPVCPTNVHSSTEVLPSQAGKRVARSCWSED